VCACHGLQVRHLAQVQHALVQHRQQAARGGVSRVGREEIRVWVRGGARDASTRAQSAERPATHRTQSSSEPPRCTAVAAASARRSDSSSSCSRVWWVGGSGAV
jgi:hypothetical protein